MELEKEKLRKEYQAEIASLNEELTYLKEQISSQESMIKSAFDYASKLERALEEFNNRVLNDKARLKQSHH